MKKVYISIALLLTVWTGISAQTIEESSAVYQQFVQLANSGGDKGQMYNVLYQCYTKTQAVLDKSQSTSADYKQAISNMKDILPYLPNAAAYSSSTGNNTNAIIFAKAYVDIALRQDFSAFAYTSTPTFAKMSYFAAANLVNSHQYKTAIPYLQAYLRSGEETYKKTVCINLIKACSLAKEYSAGISALDEAIASYPSDYSILSTAVNFCIDSGDNQNLQRYVSKALSIRPNDQTLLNIQGKLYEDNRKYEEALEIYTKLQKSHPNALDVAKHLAIDNYNIGVLNFNNSLSEQDKNMAKNYRKEYEKYFLEAIDHLKGVVASDPTSMKYTQALAIAYNCTGNKAQLETVNNKLASMGGGRVASDYIPTLISYSQETVQPSGNLVASNSSRPITSPSSFVSATSTPSETKEIPAYSAFAKDFIESKINEWQKKDDYETLDEYRARVTEQTRNDKIKEVKREAEQEYINRYKSLVNLNQMDLKPYDAEHGVFLVTSNTLGQLIVPVPRSNNEARLFEANWSGMQFKDAKYFIADDHLALANLTFVTPTGKSYQYDNDAALNYTETNVDVNFNPIDQSLLAADNSGSKKKAKVSKQNVSLGKSDVDMNIPEVKAENTTTFAVVISNENYSNVAGVPMALNDGTTFAKYCEKTLGMPHDNVRYYPDASYGTMLRAMRDIKDIAQAFNGDLNIVFYYAGHGIPNESTKDAYLLPIDADGTQTEGCYSLNKLYSELGSTGAKSVVVFLDACFSGSKREEGMLASARGVALKAKKEDPRGNMVVFSAATDDETAFPYKEKNHGLFTYYLLKKLQDSKGDVSLGELSEYITANVKRQSVVINHKMQTPTATPSASLTASWRNIKIR